MIELAFMEAKTESARMVQERDEGVARELDLTKQLKNLEERLVLEKKADVERRGQETTTLMKEFQHERALKEQVQVERDEDSKRHRQELEDKKTDFKQMEARMARLQQEVEEVRVLIFEWKQQMMII